MSPALHPLDGRSCKGRDERCPGGGDAEGERGILSLEAALLMS